MSGYVAHHDDTVVIVDRQDHFTVEWAGTNKWERLDTREMVVEQLARRGLYDAAVSVIKYGREE